MMSKAGETHYNLQRSKTLRNADDGDDNAGNDYNDEDDDGDDTPTIMRC